MDGFALRHAVHFGHTEVVRVLCEAGADVDVADGEALRWARNVGNSAILNILETSKSRKNGLMNGVELN
jgi:ankyrin repeat protein